MALLRGRARLGALTLAYPHTPPFPSWGRFEEVRQSRCASMYERAVKYGTTVRVYLLVLLSRAAASSICVLVPRETVF